jgi:hypothetical protein
MQQLPGKRALALAIALAFATAGAASAQDTTEAGGARFDTTEAGAGAIDTTTPDSSAKMDSSAVNDTTGASGVQNPPGYSGMERDTTMFPDKGGPPATPDQVEDQTTGTYEDSASTDTSGTAQNPPGYRGMERPAGIDSAAGHDSAHGTGGAAGDTTAAAPDSAH